MKLFGFHLIRDDIMKVYAKKCDEVMALEKTVCCKTSELDAFKKEYDELKAKHEECTDNLLCLQDTVKDYKDRLDKANTAYAELLAKYEQLMADAEKLRADSETHIVNPRKKRASKKVAHAIPEFDCAVQG